MKSDSRKGWIGAAAVEDDGIYFTVAEVVRGKPGGRRRRDRPDRASRPKEGYSTQFIEDAILSYFDNVDIELDGIGISMFGLIDGMTLIDMPRRDWVKNTDTYIDFGKLLGNRNGKKTQIFLGHDSTTSAVGEYMAIQDSSRRRFKPFDPAGFVRIRVGTGVGVGYLGRGFVRAGLVHPEAGHIPVVRHVADTSFRETTCRVHNKNQQACLEGLLSDQAIRARCKGAGSLEEIPPKHEVWDIVADYLAQLCVVITMLIAPNIIVIGGRTMIIANKKKPDLDILDKIQKNFEEKIGGYPRYEITNNLDNYICSSIVTNPAYASLTGVVELTRREIFRVVGRIDDARSEAGRN